MTLLYIIMFFVWEKLRNVLNRNILSINLSENGESYIHSDERLDAESERDPRWRPPRKDNDWGGEG